MPDLATNDSFSILFFPCSFDPLAVLGNAMLDFVPRLPLVVGGFILSETHRDGDEWLAILGCVGRVTKTEMQVEASGRTRVSNSR